MCGVCVRACMHVRVFSMDTDDSQPNAMTFCVILCNDQDDTCQSRGGHTSLSLSTPRQYEVNSKIFQN